MALKWRKTPKILGRKIGVFGEFLEFLGVFGVVWGVFGEALCRRKIGRKDVQYRPGEHLKMKDFDIRGGEGTTIHTDIVNYL